METLILGFTEPKGRKEGENTGLASRVYSCYKQSIFFS